MIVHLLRHTTPKIAKGICYGQADIELADTFVEELQTIKKQLSSLQYTTVISSPLYRCSHLAKQLLKPKVKLQLDQRLMELNFGDWELKSWETISEDTTSKVWFKDYINQKCPNGESFKDLQQRVINFISELKTKNNTALLVTHAGVIRTFQCILENKPLTNAFNISVEYGALKTVTL